MRKIYIVLAALIVPLLMAQAVIASETIVRASSAGARLDTDLLKGGGTDDTAALQAVLDRAADGKPIQLIVDGAALVRGLNVYGNTTIECLQGGGLYLKDGSSRALIRNAHRSKEVIADEHITIRGCFFNGNRDNQPSADISRADMPDRKPTPSNREADGTFITGLQFLGVNDLIIENVTLWSIRSFGALIANASRVAITNLTVDVGAQDIRPAQFSTTDGLALKGPLRYVIVDGLKLRTGDDGLAINADTWPEMEKVYGPYVGLGPITDVTISNVHFMDTIVGIRFLSAKERVDRVTIRNVTGKIRGCCAVAVFSHWVNPSGLGNFGSIIFDNVNVDRSLNAATMARTNAVGSTPRNLGKTAKALAREFNDGAVPYISINSHVESLVLRNIVTKVTDDRPILYLGPDGRVQTMSAELTLLDPTLQAMPLKLAQDAYIERLDFALRWNGSEAAQSKNPIVSSGGTVRQLYWVNTPPMYVKGERLGTNDVVVTFSQAIKATDLVAGVSIRLNDKLAKIMRAEREAGRFDAVRYVLADSFGAGAKISWGYQAALGSIENLSGDQMLSVAETRVGVQ